MTEIDHEPRWQSRIFQQIRRSADTLAVEIRLQPTSKDHVPVFVAGSLKNPKIARFGHGQKMMRVCSRRNCVNGNFQIPVRAVFEPHRTGQSGSQLTVQLAFRCAGADRAPADQVCDVLGCQQVEVFSASRHTYMVQIKQQLSCQPDPVINIEGTIEIGVIDQAFPAHCCPGFFKIDPHDDQQII